MTRQPTHIDLFSGIGGFALAAQWAGFQTVAFVEIEPYAQELLRQNFGAVADAESVEGWDKRDNSTNGYGWQSGNEFGPARIIADIRQFDGTAYRGATLLTGGFPCQPFSQAGKRRGKEDDRYLWPEMLRVIHEARPRWVLGENVAGIIQMELDRCLSDLEGEGYSCQALVIPACAVDAKHRRDRVWIVGHASGGGCSRDNGRRARSELEDRCEDVADASKQQRYWWSDGPSWWSREPQQALSDARLRGRQEAWMSIPESLLGRVANGVSSRVDRLKGLGNAIVPQVAYEIIRGIAEIEK